MELKSAGISEQPFRTHGRPLTFVQYQGQIAAHEFLRGICRSPVGVGLLQGPSLSGKTTLLHQFAASQDDEASVAIIDGADCDARALLQGLIDEFGFELKLETLSEMTSLLRVFAMQQAAAHDAPLVIIENAHGLAPDALQLLAELAGLTVDDQCALRFVLSSDRSLTGLLRTPGMETLSARLTGTFNLVPMDDEETVMYVHAKLRAGGCKDPHAVVPASVCAELHEASGGWPGIVDRLMLLALARADELPLTLEHIERPVVPSLTGKAGLQSISAKGRESSQAKLYLTYNGRTLREIPLDQPRIMLGRSEHNDVSIASRFVSRHHALFIRDGNTTLLMDLNSTNGTFVNSQRISNHIMVHDDVVNLGHHGLKFHDPAARQQHPLQGADFNDTVIMKSLDDMRRVMARENTQPVDDAPAEAANAD